MDRAIDGPALRDVLAWDSSPGCSLLLEAGGPMLSLGSWMFETRSSTVEDVADCLPMAKPVATKDNWRSVLVCGTLLRGVTVDSLSLRDGEPCCSSTLCEPVRNMWETMIKVLLH